MFRVMARLPSLAEVLDLGYTDVVPGDVAAVTVVGADRGRTGAAGRGEWSPAHVERMRARAEIKPCAIPVDHHVRGAVTVEVRGFCPAAGSDSCLADRKCLVA